MISAEAFKARARELGFNLVGVTPARPAPHLAAYLRWVAAGRHGEMGYLAREDRGDYVMERVDFNTTPDIRVPACVLIPKKADFPAPGIVALSQQ